MAKRLVDASSVLTEPAEVADPVAPWANRRSRLATALHPTPDAPRPTPALPHAIEFDRVSCGYDGVAVVRGVSLTVPRGGFVGLVGPSGAGKTTLLRALLGAVPTTRGRVVVEGRAVRPGQPPAGIGYVPQVETVDWTFPVTVEDLVLMGRIRRMGMLPWPSRADRRAVGATLDRLGIGDLRRRHIRDLSGGQQQRVFLARALIGEPRLLLLDEPTASVDVRTRETMLRLLLELNRAGTTIVVTTHELGAVAGRLPWIVCINGGVVAQGSPDTVFEPTILSRTFGTPIRVVRDDESGGWLIGEAIAPVPDGDPSLSASGRPHVPSSNGHSGAVPSRAHPYVEIVTPEAAHPIAATLDRDANRA